MGKICLSGGLEIQIPKSINRLRIQGAGNRFVHGGASLQEIIIPIVKVNKKRRGYLSTVAVEIIRNSTSTITSGQLAVTFYQQEPVTDKVQPPMLKAGIYAQIGELISDLHELTFDSPSENPTLRNALFNPCREEKISVFIPLSLFLPNPILESIFFSLIFPQNYYIYGRTDYHYT